VPCVVSPRHVTRVRRRPHRRLVIPAVRRTRSQLLSPPVFPKSLSAQWLYPLGSRSCDA
jgi:hypothetical protein